MECMVHGVKKGRCWVKLKVVVVILMKAWISCCVIWTLSHKLCGVIEGLWAGAMDEHPSYPLRWKHSLYSAPMGDRIKTSLTQAPFPQMPLQNLSIVHLSYCFLSSNLWFSDFSLECVVVLWILQTHLDAPSSLSDLSFLLSYQLLDFSVICRLK